jgi:pSer/pThr/pTyr-binding forkhead associated (FHA) protein
MMRETKSGFPPCALYRSASGQRLKLWLNRPVVIGRSQAANLRVDDATVSAVHCAILPVRPLAGLPPCQSGWLVCDLHSTNGTYLNGQRLIRPMPLLDGDSIRFGDLGSVSVVLPG